MSLRLLLLEEDARDAQLIREMLGTENDTEVVSVECLSAGLERMAQRPFDAVLLALDTANCTDRSPLAVLQERAPGLPIVALTGSDDDTLALLAVKDGAQDCLIKGRVDGATIRRAVALAIEKKRSLEALRKSEERLRSVVENMPVMLEAFDAGGLIVAWNRECERVTGYATDEIVGNPAAVELLYPDEAAGRRMSTHSGESTTDSETHECRLRAKDDTHRIVAWTTIAKRSPIPGWAAWAVGTDVTHLRETERALRESERQHRQLIELAQEGIWAVDAEAATTFVNPRMAAMLGLTLEEVLGRPLADFTNEEGARKAREDFERKREGLSDQFEFEFLRKDGRKILTLISTNPITDETGHFIGAMAVVSDLTENRRLQEELHQARKMESIGRLAAGIAREINTPTQGVCDSVSFLADALKNLDGIVTRAQRLTGENGTAPGVAELQEAIQKAALPHLQEEIPKALARAREGLDRIARIVRAMKEFSHPGHEEKKPTDLNHAIETTVTVARNEWKYVAEVKLELAPDLPLVPCLPGEINQVLLNLLVNAAHAIEGVVGNTKRKGLITIRSRQDKNCAEIGVRDTGVGISDVVRQRLFEPFFTARPQGRETGQGLALAWNVIVKKHKGTLDVRTESGKGTEFVLRLPLVEDADASKTVKGGIPLVRNADGTVRPPLAVREGVTARKGAEVTPRGHDGTVRRAIRFGGPEGQYAGHMGTRVDADETRRVQAELRRKDRYLELLQCAATHTDEATSVEAAVQVFVDLVCGFTDWPIGHACWFQRNASRQQHLWHAGNGKTYQRFRHALEVAPSPWDCPTHGPRLVAGDPIWCNKFGRNDGCGLSEAADEAHLHSSLFVPLQVCANWRALLQFFSPYLHETDPGFLQVVRMLALQLSRTLQRKLDQEALRESEERFKTINQSALDAIVVVDSRYHGPSATGGGDATDGAGRETGIH